MFDLSMFKLIIWGYVNETASPFVYFSKDNNFYGLKVIESLSLLQEGLFAKCFTFFSDLDESMKKFKIDFKTIEINFEPSYKCFPLNKLEEAWIYLHSLNTFPDYSERITFDLNSDYSFKYNEMTTELLGNGYETNCSMYDYENKLAQFNFDQIV